MSKSRVIFFPLPFEGETHFQQKMSLFLSFHHFSLSSKPPFHHYHPYYTHHYTSLHYPTCKTRKKPLKSHLQSTSNYNSETLPKSAIQRIAEKLRTLGFVEDNIKDTQLPEHEINPKIGEIFIPTSRQIPNFRVGHTLDPSWSTPQNPVPEPGTGDAIIKLNGLSWVAQKERKEFRKAEKEEEKGKVPSLAELTLSGSELRRLTTMGIRMKQKMKLGKAGITEGVVNGIHERWRSFEVVKIVCEDICRLNMKRTHVLLERKTGGMVVWRTGSKIVLYRGVNYKYPYFSLDEASVSSSSDNTKEVGDGMQAEEENLPSETLIKSSDRSETRILAHSSLVPGVGSPNRVRFLLPGETQLVEEADRLLDGLGPRFTDWWGCEPLPIDADLLPAVVPRYRKPFRLLPYGVKPQLTNDEMTILKRLGRPLPCHFALGRNRNLQGLAAAILRLWEKCEIVKVAVKRGVQNTNSELMAEELKRLTGGILLSRDKEYIVFYRGKDFLPSAVSSAIEERRRNRMDGDKLVADGSSGETTDKILRGTEGQHAAFVSEKSKGQTMRNVSQEQKMRSVQTNIARTSRKLSMTIEKKARTEKLLSELEQAEISRNTEVDKEGITEEERYMLRRVGLRMKPFLLLGRRGVFDGTIENMHLHWKYRELVKIICGGRNIDEIQNIARILEAESGGILVAVERDRKGHAIIVYRGKNYQRPASLRPDTLLNKKEALKRSIEAQRRESLKLDVLKLAKNIEELKLKLGEDKEALDNEAGKRVNSQWLNKSGENIPTNRRRVFKDSQENIHSIQEEEPVNVSSFNDNTLEAADSFSVDDDFEESSEINLVSSVDSGKANASCDKPLQSINNEVEPSVSIDNSEHENVEDEITKPSTEENKKEVISRSFQNKVEKNPYAVRAGAKPLTNKERLLLRQQALKTKRRPVLAVGRSNVVTGVAKAIKDHFKKYPLAIVNVKGRAKGTSVQEVVFKLEQETGGVLVSQEPSKIILYRGWGAEVKTDRSFNNKEDCDKRSGVPSLAVSPELLAAMKLECGLSDNENEET
ncbi:CRM-domain containing factor CFM2, chloroplastic [Amaranthus tricolor]|uniref:CRM-domain containing factor CFM2, chloroplastic n=1 Tax=Amaranthus tricolor TaxID=29722 RepID=UPI00258D2ADD|nr:CRM-domain containing factor CFM2, chloroplastic [Amaranthus tricolor]XP_057536597.1 CRM-domain containing factor CFM2, chloroplastic [Amaranthus tricolor]XP_057536598.1 CRM-domain containing factor CFM2, chloroplastic [Amaranthus tricolor]XP_057536599.1 CRM-domain containing factor CFM2, chloroplastic [Amaranthus tricolor]XP_057536600.1 CRM-domain containing factor CFM2, chloroplastic [Amaranthus tricolor]